MNVLFDLSNRTILDTNKSVRDFLLILMHVGFQMPNAGGLWARVRLQGRRAARWRFQVGFLWLNHYSFFLESYIFSEIFSGNFYFSQISIF